MNTQSPYRIARGRMGKNAFPFGGFGGTSNPGQVATRNMLVGFEGLNLGINKTQFLVGDAPNYVITGAAPNTPVLWTSTKNGLATGENQSNYGQTTDANGNLTGSGGVWTSNDIGTWTKTATVGNENFTVTFAVVPLSASSSGASGQLIPYYSLPGQRVSSAAAASDNINVFGYNVPRIPFYIAVAALAFYLVKGKK